MSGESRLAEGSATCALCHAALTPGADAVVTPDFLADEGDPFFAFSDAAMHRACFVVWDRRKRFVAHFNRLARRLVADDGSYPQMTADGELIRRWGDRPPAGPIV